MDVARSETTAHLVAQARRGDPLALEGLLDQFTQPLHAWARGRLPPPVFGAEDWGDLVKDAVLAALGRLDRFEACQQEALLTYLKVAVMNRIREAIVQRRCTDTVRPPVELGEASPFDEGIAAEDLRGYDDAIERLEATDREAIVGRLELQYSYDELARVLDKPSAAAARIAVVRAITRLGDQLRHASSTAAD